MGLGVAECFAAAGIEVVLTDATPELTREAKERLVRRARGHADAGPLAENSVGRVEAVETADDVAGTVADADLVFGAVPEDIGLKEEILRLFGWPARRRYRLRCGVASLQRPLG